MQVRQSLLSTVIYNTLDGTSEKVASLEIPNCYAAQNQCAKFSKKGLVAFVHMQNGDETRKFKRSNLMTFSNLSYNVVRHRYDFYASFFTRIQGFCT